MFDRDHIGVHSYINLALGVHSHVVRITKIECTPIWSVPETNALPFGPFRYQECTPMWSLLIFGVHSHLVP